MAVRNRHDALPAQSVQTEQDTSRDTPRDTPREFRRDSRRNMVAYIGDTSSFLGGMFFIPATTVLVGLASALTSDKALIGVVAMSWTVASSIPQLVAAKLVHGKRRQKPYVVVPSLIGRQTILLFAVWLLVSNAQPPLLTLGLLIAAVVIFNIFDAITGIAWLDMINRNLTPRRRGRVIGTAQLLGSVLGIGSGLIVGRLLSPGGLPFPQNYAVIFICAWVGFMISLGFQFCLDENPMPEQTVSASNDGTFSGHMLAALRTDAVFRRVLIARVLTSIEAMAAAFYVVFIRERLQLPDNSIGVFSVAFIAGGIVGVALLGPLAERAGARSVVHVAAALQAAAPLLAFVVAVVPGLIIPPALAYGLFIVILAIDGAVGRSTILGFASYTIDHAPDRRRAIYVGVLNTLGGLVALSPALGGVFLDAASRNHGTPTGYAIMFGAVALCAALGAVISFTLPRPAQHDA